VVTALNNEVRDNTVTGCTDGVRMIQTGTGNNVFERNILSGNSDGIHLTFAGGNTFDRNEITGNARGLYLESGVSNNKLYHNNIAGNTVSIVSATTHANVWDDGYPSAGNYWSNYAGTDANHDGIGDTPYAIDALNQDRYPLMGPYDSRIHDVAIVAVSAMPTTVVGGDPVTVTVTVANQGNWWETFAVTAYYGTTPIGTQTVTGLAPSTQTVLTFIWVTTGVAPGQYQIKAVAATVSGEMDTGDNTFVDGTVTVQQPPVKMHVQSITFATSWSGKTQKLSITVTIKDRSGNPVSGATVYGELTLPGGAKVVYSGATGTSGTVTFTYSVRNSALPSGTYVFTVTNVTHATAQYVPAENVETTDSYAI
jgi:parallel beta-helix repeat protein